MSEKPRELPSWMVKKVKVKEKEPPLLLLSRRKSKVARSVCYCMNEKELVEAVASYLTNGVCEDVAPRTDHKVVDRTEDRTVKLRGEKSASSSKTKAKSVTVDLEEESSDCSAAQESTYVSETDLDITEVETVPFTMNQQQSVPEGQRSGPAQGHTSVELDTENREERSHRPAQVDEDDMRLVKEIFFT